MPCYEPISAYHRPGGGITFVRSQSNGNKIELPCGRCLGCRLEKAKEWALRCSHEASMHDQGRNNSFLTLTYRDEDLPDHGNLNRKHFPIFIRALRDKTKKKIRYYMCGEYGDKNNRPHYHALLFGFQFPDRRMVNVRKGNRVYTSKMLDTIWGRGTCEIGSATFQSAGYVARYILKKQTGTAQDVFDRYVIIDTSTGEMTARENEYTNMSLKPGIGEKWYRQNKQDLFPHDYAVLPDGRQTSVPTYYRRLLEREDPVLHEKLKNIRIEKSKADPNNSPERLAVISDCQHQKQSRMTRDLPK